MDNEHPKPERFLSIGSPTGETTVDLQRVVMVRQDGLSVILQFDCGLSVTGGIDGGRAGEVYREVTTAWKRWLTAAEAQR